jgi:transcriptional regulator with XRE-family HTH domain
MFTTTTDPAIRSSKIPDSAIRALNSVDVHIGSRLRIRRTSREMNEEDLSRLVGVDRRNLTAYEAGAQRINASLLLRIANVLDVRPDYFFQGYARGDSRD